MRLLKYKQKVVPYVHYMLCFFAINEINFKSLSLWHKYSLICCT